MDFKGLDLNLLVLLDVLLEEKNITRTGIRIHLSQSATSGALARLRDHFHDDLLVQVSNKLLLTPLAESLVLPIRHLLMQAQVIVDTTTIFSPATTSRKVTIMCSDYIAIILMPEVIRVLQHHAPLMTVELLPFTDVPSDALARGEMDFLLMPDMHLSPGHPNRKLFEDDFVCVVWQGNRKVGETISAEQYLEMGHVIVEFGRQRTESVDQGFFRKLGLQRKAEIIVNDFNVIPHLLHGTTRIATMHRKLANVYADRFGLRILDLPFDFPQIVEFLQWHEYRQQDPAHRWLRKLIRQVAAGLGTQAGKEL
jgi:LysR family nod box-dependent transcriptional activator